LRVAIVSDIHGSLPALEAVVAELERESPDDVWCGGDLGWGGGWASECVALVRERGWTTVKGNTDVWITGDPQTLESPDDRRQLETIAAAHAISDDDAQWLLNLPLGHSGPGSILLVHGTPETPFFAPEPYDPAAEFAPYEGHANVVVYGHVHEAFTRRLTDGTIVVNAGSVGASKDEATACYLLLAHDGPEIVLRHRRVPYDRDAVRTRARELGAPLDEYIIRNLGGG
jgi:putative phosphoesterase